MNIAERVSNVLDGRLSRRSFIVRATFVGSALAVGGKDFLLRPRTAYNQLCGYPSCGGDCDCASACCVDYTEFCCVLDGGYNSCPSDTIMGGWWMAEGSEYCSGPRYYMDCNGVCHCDTGCGSFCDTGCDGLTCECAGGSCANYRTGCLQFRYGQCNQDVACMGRIKCRVVTCVPPWEISDCTRASATDDGTANQNASCLSSGPTYPPPPCDSPSTNCEVVGIEVSQTGKGYGLVTSYGKILGYGNSESGSVQRERSTPVSALVACPLGGRWAVTQPGRVLPMLGAPYYGDALKLNLASAIVDMAATPTGKGYWLVSARGRVQAYGDAAFYGDDRSLATETPFVAIVPTATGKGYWLPTAGGRISAFGDAKYSGSPLTLHLEDPIVGMASDGAGGYWAVSSGGRVLPYGGAGRYGDPVNKPLPYPIVAMAATHIGKGYYLVASDGEIFNYGDAVYYGDPIKKKG